MFTGIVQAYVEVSEVLEKQDLTTFSLTFPEELLEGLEQGASIAIDGVCFTTTSVEGKRVFFDAMKETLQRTTIGHIKEGKYVNVERSFKIGDEVGGHIVSGHVHAKVEIIKVDTSIPNNHIITFKVPHHLMKYIFSKGYVALDGVSLTLVDVNKTDDTFTVYLIPETLKRTTFGIKGKGEWVNIEIDTQTQTIVDTVERVLAEKQVGL
ncbi:MAG TPA: riboflavin synthase subunit alpha [Thioploca sp.]|nr:MAG: riboflavin synthase [Beggiatoa sp. 4572_84]RKZ55127.1 MAG: riboflavin synthase [Gammaproteobacteria bacterium]HDN27593.1 riboflavin synthase subunit alpha [Thioploca sp.]